MAVFFASTVLEKIVNGAHLPFILKNANGVQFKFKFQNVNGVQFKFTIFVN